MGGSNRKPGLILTVRDRHLLSELLILRVIDREQAKVVGPFGSTPRANARLLQLTQAGYLSRMFVGTITGGRKAVYALPGRHLPTRRGPYARQEAFAHQLAVNRVHLAFRYSAPPGRVSFGGWQHFDQPLSADAPLIPDGLLRVETPEGTIPAFVEVDLSTEALSVWERKAALYLHLAASGAYRAHLSEDRFRVLVVADSARRREAMRAVIARQTDKLFWLATAREVEEQTPWGPIWVRPHSGQAQYLLPPKQRPEYCPERH